MQTQLPTLRVGAYSDQANRFGPPVHLSADTGHNDGRRLLLLLSRKQTFILPLHGRWNAESIYGHSTKNACPSLQGYISQYIYTVSLKNDTVLAWYNFDLHHRF